MTAIHIAMENISSAARFCRSRRRWNAATAPAMNANRWTSCDHHMYEAIREGRIEHDLPPIRRQKPFVGRECITMRSLHTAARRRDSERADQRTDCNKRGGDELY